MALVLSGWSGHRSTLDPLGRLFQASALALAVCGSVLTAARAQSSEPLEGTFTAPELLDAGQRSFGSMSGGLSLAVETAVDRWGEPNAYILGDEASGALFGGLRYGRGTLHTRNAGQRQTFWQGPSFGLDLGGDGARTIMLVYNLPTVPALFGRFIGLNGAAYFVGGFSITAAVRDGIVVVPIRSGVGARLGINVGYLKFTPQRAWNPF